MIIKWHDIHSVNVKEIDEQHKKLIGIINKFFEFDAADKTGMLGIVKEMSDYANYHLTTEEAYFKKFQYPKTVEHQKQHDFYREKVADLTTKLQNNETVAVFKELAEFLREWWINHINNTDQEYSEFFNDHGLY